jgi:hypothetical protein
MNELTEQMNAKFDELASQNARLETENKQLKIGDFFTSSN